MCAVDTHHTSKIRTIRLYRSLPRLLRDPIEQIQRIGYPSGEFVRLDFGIFRAFVATHPDHVQHILRDDSAGFVRGGTFWRPLHRLFGDGILADGPDWELSRRALQPVFTARHVGTVADRMAETINEAVEVLAEPAEAGRPIPMTPALATIVNRTVLRVFFGGKISDEENARLAPAFDDVARAVAFRFLLPFLPASVPVPGDQAFRHAVRRIDDAMYPLIRRYRRDDDTSPDFFTALCAARRADGGPVTERWIRDNLVALFATGTETTVGALTWLWPLLDAHPEVAERLYQEIDQVVGAGPVRAEHLPGLTYTRRVVQELLRLYPAAWLFPRRAVRAARIGGRTVDAGDTVLLSPFLTHRLPAFWERPSRFDPDRFLASRGGGRRHRYSYFPFGGGPHQCIGMHVFNTEAELIIAAVLSRFRPTACGAVPFSPRIGPTLRPREGVKLTLRPR